jgi:ATP-binding cassette subfamily C protein
MMDRTGLAWLVQSGHVDLFLVELRNGEPAGCRSHVLRAVQGEVVCGMGGRADGMAVLARPAPETSLKEVTQESLLAAPEGVRKLEVWLGRLGEAFSGTLPPKQQERLEPWRQIRVEEEEKSAVPVADVAWVRVLKGRTRLMGDPSLPVLRNASDRGACFPVPRKAWLLAEPGTVLDVVDSIAARETDPSGEGLAEFHEHAICALVLAHGKAEAKEQQRLRAKAASASAALECSLHALQTPVNGNAEAPHAPKAIAPVFRACEIAIADLGMTVETPTGIPGESRSGVVALAVAAGLRVREILLRENWWYEYSGPMVAFRKEDGLPVALIRGGSTGYRIHHPSERRPVKVTGVNAGELTGVAFLFYRPFPMRSLTFKDLLVFGLTGSRRELGFMILMGIAAGVLALAAPLAFRALFDHVIPNAERGQVALLGALLALSAVCTTLFNIAGGFATLRIETRIASSLQTALWDRLLNLPVSFFRAYTTGDLASRSTAVDRIRQTLTGPIITSAWPQSCLRFNWLCCSSIARGWRSSRWVCWQPPSLLQPFSACSRCIRSGRSRPCRAASPVSCRNSLVASQKFVSPEPKCARLPTGQNAFPLAAASGSGPAAWPTH